MPQLAVVSPVEQFLHQAVRAGFGSAGHARRRAGPGRSRSPPGEWVRLPIRARWVGFAFDFHRLSSLPGDHTPVPGRAAAASVRGVRVVPGSPFFRRSPAGLEGRPGALQAVPRAVDRLVELLIAGQVVIIGGQPAQLCVASQDALEQVGREERAFGVDGGEGVTVAGLHSC